MHVYIYTYVCICNICIYLYDTMYIHVHLIVIVIDSNRIKRNTGNWCANSSRDVQLLRYLRTGTHGPHQEVVNEERISSPLHIITICSV